MEWGFGLVEYSKFLVNNGIDFLAVANIEEAISLRQAGITEEILILTPYFKEKELQKLAEYSITCCVSNLEQLKKLEKIAEENQVEIKAHLKIDTGFGRYGLLYTNLDQILQVFEISRRVKITGTYTHFACAKDEKFTNTQFNRFLDIIKFLKENEKDPGLLHVSESTAFLKYKMMNLNAVRLRINHSRKNINKS